MEVDKELAIEVQEELSTDSYIPDLEFIESIIAVYEKRKLIRNSLAVIFNETK